MLYRSTYTIADRLELDHKPLKCPYPTLSLSVYWYMGGQSSPWVPWYFLLNVTVPSKILWSMNRCWIFVGRGQKWERSYFSRMLMSLHLLSLWLNTLKLDCHIPIKKIIYACIPSFSLLHWHMKHFKLFHPYKNGLNIFYCIYLTNQCLQVNLFFGHIKKMLMAYICYSLFVFLLIYRDLVTV